MLHGSKLIQGQRGRATEDVALELAKLVPAAADLGGDQARKPKSQTLYK